MRIFLAIIFMVLSGVNLRAGTIVVQGEGHVHHPPSYVLLDLSFREEGQNAGMILSALRSRVDAAVLAFERNGIPKKHIKSRRFNVYLDQNFQAKPAKKPRYIAETMLSIRQNDINQLGLLLDVAAITDVNGISQLNFAHDATQEDHDLALSHAVKSALRKARVLAEAAGQTLGDIQLIQEEGTGGHRPVTFQRMEAFSVQGFVAPTGVTISKTVILEIEMMDGAAQ